MFYVENANLGFLPFNTLHYYYYYYYMYKPLLFYGMGPNSGWT